MQQNKFLIQLLIITTVSIIVALLGNYVPLLSGHTLAAFVYIIFFSIFSFFSFISAKKAIKKTGVGHYIRFNLTLIFCKMLACITLVVLFTYLVKPFDNNHVLYFILFYVGYSVFEYITLSKIGYEK